MPEALTNPPQPSKRRFLLKLALYVLPFAVPFLLLSGFLVYTGEALPLSLVARLQMSEEPVLYRPRYGNRDFAYKTIAANLRHPDILAVGSSRVLQFRSLFFNRQPDQFYNGGAPAWTLDRVIAYIKGLDFTPKILILALDQPWFNANYTGEFIDPDTGDFAHLFMVNRSFAQAVLDGESFDIARYLARREPAYGGLALGLRAIRDGHGFRNDGSEQYGDFLVAHWLYPENERQRHLDYLRDGAEMYAYGDAVSAAQLGVLDDFLAWCAERGITVIGFLPSYMPSLYPSLIGGGSHAYVGQLQAALPPLFDGYGFAYFDFSDGAALGAADADFFDGWHASERLNLRLYREMLAALPDTLGAYSDPGFLAQADETAADTFDVFGMRYLR